MASKLNINQDFEDEPVKKRKMRRRPARQREEFKKKYGMTVQERVKGYQHKLAKKNLAIKQRREREVRQRQQLRNDLKAEIRKCEVLRRRENGKWQTKYDKLKAKYDELKKRKNFKTVVNRNKYITYEPPTLIRHFEEKTLEARETNESYISMLERITKVTRFLENYNEKSNTNLNVTHVLILLSLYVLRGEVKGITAPKLSFPMTSQHQIRTSLNYLADAGLLTRVTRINFRINALTEDFLKDINNFDSYGKSQTVALLEKFTGFKRD